MMYSLEEMAEITGDVQFADHLERVAFNALPTQATDAYDARQYYQQVNQVMITDGPSSRKTCGMPPTTAGWPRWSIRPATSRPKWPAAYG